MATECKTRKQHNISNIEVMSELHHYFLQYRKILKTDRNSKNMYQLQISKFAESGKVAFVSQSPILAYDVDHCQDPKGHKIDEANAVSANPVFEGELPLSDHTFLGRWMIVVEPTVSILQNNIAESYQE